MPAEVSMMAARDRQEGREQPGTAEQRAKWEAQATPTLQAFSDGLWDGKQRLFVRMFVYDSGLCWKESWQDFGLPLTATRWPLRPAAEQLVARTRHFLGPFMLDHFDIMRLLEDAGLWVDAVDRHASGSDDTDEPDWDDDDENGEHAERKYSAATFEAAGLAVQGLLRTLVAAGFYAVEELREALVIAALAVEELPRCALLGQYLPGPLNVLKDLMLSKAGGEDGRPPMPSLADIETGVTERFMFIAPRFNFRRVAEALFTSDLRVTRTLEKRLRVVRVESRRWVVLCPADPCGGPDDQGGAEGPGSMRVEVDPELGCLFAPGLLITGTFCLLSDGSWYLAQSGVVWPSYRSACHLEYSDDDDEDGGGSGTASETNDGNEVSF